MFVYDGACAHSVDPEEMKQLEAELVASRQNNASWRNTVDRLKSIGDDQVKEENQREKDKERHRKTDGG